MQLRFEWFPRRWVFNFKFPVLDLPVYIAQEVFFKHWFHHLIGEQVSLVGVFFQVDPVQLFVDTAAAHNAMHVRVEAQLLAPGM